MIEVPVFFVAVIEDHSQQQEAALKTLPNGSFHRFSHNVAAYFFKVSRRISLISGRVPVPLLKDSPDSVTYPGYSLFWLTQNQLIRDLNDICKIPLVVIKEVILHHLYRSYPHSRVYKGIQGMYTTGWESWGLSQNSAYQRWGRGKEEGSARIGNLRAECWRMNLSALGCQGREGSRKGGKGIMERQKTTALKKPVQWQWNCSVGP